MKKEKQIKREIIEKEGDNMNKEEQIKNYNIQKEKINKQMEKWYYIIPAEMIIAAITGVMTFIPAMIDMAGIMTIVSIMSIYAGIASAKVAASKMDEISMIDKKIKKIEKQSNKSNTTEFEKIITEIAEKDDDIVIDDKYMDIISKYIDKMMSQNEEQNEIAKRYIKY